MNSTTQLAILGAAGAALYIANRKGSYTDSGTPPTTPSSKPNFKTLQHKGVTQQILQKLGAIQKVGTQKTGGASGYSKEVEDRIKADLKKKWEQASNEAKIAICNNLKKQFPKDAGIQAMNCAKAASMEFQAVVAVVGAAAGMAVCGPPCSVVGSLVAAYAGPKLEEYAREAGDAIKYHAEDLWNNAKEVFPWNW